MSTKDETGPRNAARREMLKRIGVAGAAAMVPTTELTRSAHAADAKPVDTSSREALETLTAAPKPIRKSAYDDSMFSKREGGHGH